MHRLARRDASHTRLPVPDDGQGNQYRRRSECLRRCCSNSAKADLPKFVLIRAIRVKVSMSLCGKNPLLRNEPNFQRKHLSIKVICTSTTCQTTLIKPIQAWACPEGVLPMILLASQAGSSSRQAESSCVKPCQAVLREKKIVYFYEPLLEPITVRPAGLPRSSLARLGWRNLDVPAFDLLQPNVTYLRPPPPGPNSPNQPEKKFHSPITHIFVMLLTRFK
jgi:hypothetical protein